MLKINQLLNLRNYFIKLKKICVYFKRMDLRLHKAQLISLCSQAFSEMQGGKILDSKEQLMHLQEKQSHEFFCKIENCLMETVNHSLLSSKSPLVWSKAGQPSGYFVQIDAKVNFGPAPIHIHATFFRGQFENTIQLMKLGAKLDKLLDVENKDENGMTLLHWAVIGGEIDIVKRLLEML